MSWLYAEPPAGQSGDHTPPSPNAFSKAVMTRALTTTNVNFNGPIGGWSSTITGGFDNVPQSFHNNKFIIPKLGHYQISYSIPYQLTPEVSASFDGVNYPGFMLCTCDKKLMYYHPIPTINTPHMKCFVSKGTLTFTVTWVLPQGSELSIFYLSSSKNQNIEDETVIPIVVAPDPHQYAWWSIVRIHV